jgi:hypothetical protein
MKNEAFEKLHKLNLDINSLLKEIAEAHEHQSNQYKEWDNSSIEGCHCHWGHVGDLKYTKSQLIEIRDRLTGNSPTKHF